MAQISIYSIEWCDLIFTDKNKNFGAYMLRKLSAKRQAFSLLIASMIFVLGVIFPSILHSITPGRESKDESARILSTFNLDKPKVEVNKILDALPPTPQFRKVIKFTPYVVTSDNLVPEEDQPKLQKEVMATTALIGNIDFKDGTDDPNAAKPEVMPAQDQSIVEEPVKPGLYLEQMPEFQGGESELYKYLQANIKYPPDARIAGITGIVYLKFVVNKDGTISDIVVLRGIGGGCDEEAVRVVKSMPAWKPGRQNGEPQPVYFNLPIKFTLLGI